MDFKCNCCDYQFNQIDLLEINERHGFEHGGYETWSLCPACKSTDFEEKVARDDSVFDFDHDLKFVSAREKQLIKAKIDLLIENVQLKLKVKQLEIDRQ